MEELRGYFAAHSQGLGHATRAVALARGLLERRSDVYLLFLAGSPALDLLVASGFDALTMPPAPDWPAKEASSGPRGGGIGITAVTFELPGGSSEGRPTGATIAF